MLAEEGVGVAREAEGVLELRAGGERLGKRSRQRHREGGVAPGPADQPRPPGTHLRDRVVVAHGDLTIVDQVRVRDRRQPVDLLPAFDDGLLGEVAARHHQRPAGCPQQQDVQRRIRQHRAEVPLAYGDLGVDRGRLRRGHTGGIAGLLLRPAADAELGARLAVRADLAPLEQYDRMLRRGQQGLLRRAHAAVPAELIEAGEHHRQRLVGAPLAQLQAAHRVTVGGVAGEVEAPEPLDGEDLAGAQQLRRRADGGRRVAFGAGGQLHRIAGASVSRLTEPQQPHARPAHRACVWLGVEAPVSWIFVLAPARRTQRELPHRRALAIVRQPLDDGEPRAAVGAVGERVVVTPVLRVEQLAPAVGAGGDVRRYQLVRVRVRGALEDHEGLTGRRAVDGGARRDVRDLVPGDVAARRRLGRQSIGERRDLRRRALRQHLHAGRSVTHPAAHAAACGERVHEGAKADALHHAADAEPDGGSLRGVARAGAAFSPGAVRSAGTHAVAPINEARACGAPLLEPAT